MIGNTLRKEREKQKLSLKDVEQATSIRTAYIEALEKGEYDKLPGEVYAKGFIKNYGNFLNLNGEELVRQFIMEISVIADKAEENQPVQDSKNKIAAKNIGKKYNSKQIETENPSEDEESFPKKYLAAAVAFVAILIGGIFYSFSGGKEIAQVENNPVPIETKTVAAVAEVPAPPVPEASVAPQPVQNSPVNEVKLQATFSGDCWTQVIVDGKLEYEGMINAGQTFDWKGSKNVNVLLGNAGAAKFVMNGQNIGAIGGEGEVVERTFTL